MSSFLLLPNELLHSIVATITDHATLLSLAFTCHTLNSIAESYLFSYISISHGPQALRFSSALDAKPIRFNHVRELLVCYNREWHTWRGMEHMPHVVARMTKLRTLRVESPLLGHRVEAWWAEECARMYMESFEMANDSRLTEAPLRALTSFTFHSHGEDSRFYHLDDILPLFVSATLQYLHISCVNFQTADLSRLDFGPTRCRTPLKTLILDECVIDSLILHKLLSLPLALTFLSMIEACFLHGRTSFINQSIPTLLSALAQQSTSLQHLQHKTPFSALSLGEPYAWTETTDLHATQGLSGLGQLQILALDWTSCLTACLLDTDLAPPALSTYRLTGLSYASLGDWEATVNYVYKFPATMWFTHLELHTQPCGIPWTHLSRYFFKHNAIEEHFKHIISVMKERNTTVKLVCYENENIMYKRPCLYWEIPFVGKVCFESERYWSLWDEHDRLMEAAATAEVAPSEVIHGIEGSSIDDGTLIAAGLPSLGLFVPKQVAEIAYWGV